MRREYVGGAQSARLSSSLGGTVADLTISCNDLSNWPTGIGGKPFYVVIDRGTISEEKILCSSRSGNTLTVYTDGPVTGRGADDTNITSHSANALIEHVFTATDADEANAHVNDSTTDVHAQYAKRVADINARTDSYTLALSDSGRLLEMRKNSPQTITVPNNTSVAFPVGTKIDILQTGTGAVTVVGASGVTINSAGAKTRINSQWESAVLLKQATNTWVLTGSLRMADPVLSWTPRTSGSTSGTIRDIATSTTTAVTVWSNGQIASSSDGTSWTLRTSSFLSSDDIYTVTFGNGLFVAGSSTGKIATSPDGTTWTQRTVGWSASFILASAYGNGVYVFGTVFGKIGSSTDGITWTERTSPFTSTPNGVRDIAYGASLFVAVGDRGQIATSPDGITWTNRTSGFGTSNIEGVSFGNGVFVAVGDGGKIGTSTDGINWTQRTGVGSDDLRRVAFGGGRFVVTADATTAVQSSVDGINWYSDSEPFSPDSTVGLGYGLSLFYASASNGLLSTSP